VQNSSSSYESAPVGSGLEDNFYSMNDESVMQTQDVIILSIGDLSRRNFKLPCRVGKAIIENFEKVKNCFLLLNIQISGET
jgi:hypothetical protein